jgi:hypothetical protein
MIHTICWRTTTPRRYYPHGMSVSVRTWFIRYVGGLLLHEAIIRPVWVFQYGHDLYDMLVDYYSTKVLSARYECFSTDMIYTICWSTTTPRRYDSVSVRTWFIRYVGRLLLHEGMTVFQYGHDLYDMLVDYYSTKVLSARYDSVSVRTWFIRYVGGLLLHEGMTVFQYGHDLYDMLVDYYSTKVWQCFSTDRIYTICWSTTTLSSKRCDRACLVNFMDWYFSWL